jgi:hypothetical protein
MSEDLIITGIEPDRLQTPEREILRSMGCTPETAKPFLKEEIGRLTPEARTRMKVIGGYRWIEELQIGPEEVTCSDVRFECGPRIAAQLKGSTGLALFAVTLGAEYDSWSKDIFREDGMSGYVADTIGSVAAESAVDWLHEKIRERATEQDLGCTNRYSPGYCGWEVMEQHKLFSLLPPGFCGILLSASALMAPAKSISGMIGFGPEAERHDYPCKACPREECLYRTS